MADRVKAVSEIAEKQNGGARPGAGRPKGGYNRKQQRAIDVAGQVLREIDAPAKWKALLNCGEPRVVADVMKYLTDRVHGKPTQRLAGEDGGPIQTVGTIRLEIIDSSGS